MNARVFGSGERIASYEVDDTQLAVGSTLGAPKGAIVIKASGAIEKFYSSDLGVTLMSGISIEFWDGPTGAGRTKVDGNFESIQTSRSTLIVSTRVSALLKNSSSSTASPAAATSIP